MKKLIIITGCLLFLSLLITSTHQSAQTPDTPPAEIAYETPKISSPTSRAELSTQKYYTIKDYNNRIAVFESGKTEPIYISNTCVSDMPLQDIQQLNQGIVVTDKKKLKRLIEDYCS
ncbi:MAG: hypothetical protein II711_03790 [Clostridia bacterium]|nr:hypothetical protein [Clostridia bacterium]